MFESDMSRFDFLLTIVFIYREIKTINDQNDLQKDLNSLQAWVSDWGMTVCDSTPSPRNVTS